MVTQHSEGGEIEHLWIKRGEVTYPDRGDPILFQFILPKGKNKTSPPVWNAPYIALGIKDSFNVSPQKVLLESTSELNKSILEDHTHTKLPVQSCENFGTWRPGKTLSTNIPAVKRQEQHLALQLRAKFSTDGFRLRLRP